MILQSMLFTDWDSLVEDDQDPEDVYSQRGIRVSLTQRPELEDLTHGRSRDDVRYRENIAVREAA